MKTFKDIEGIFIIVAIMFIAMIIYCIKTEEINKEKEIELKKLEVTQQTVVDKIEE